MKYIHYGHKTFDLNQFQKVKNQDCIPKPSGGLWASREDAAYGWREWSEETDLKVNRDEYFVFELKDNAKVLTIKSLEQLEELPQVKPPLSLPFWVILDYEKLADEYDAIEVLISEDSRLYKALYTWDCDSIVIINPDVIQI